MGGAVSAGVDNDDLIDNLIQADYLKSEKVIHVFRLVDRKDYFLPESRDQAYKDLAWRNGVLHLSAPCIYAEVMENLELREGLSFLNLGSGTGYLSTMVGLLLGASGINHGVELHESNVEYARDRVAEFIQSDAFNEVEWCEPQFSVGNCLCLAPDTRRYDRIYCGAACPPKHEAYIQGLLTVGGVLVMPLNDQLIKTCRVAEDQFESTSILPVSFASLISPSSDQPWQCVSVDDAQAPALKHLCRLKIRRVLRGRLHRKYAAALARRTCFPSVQARAPVTETTEGGRSGQRRNMRRAMFVPSSDSDEERPSPTLGFFRMLYRAEVRQSRARTTRLLFNRSRQTPRALSESSSSDSDFSEGMELDEQLGNASDNSSEPELENTGAANLVKHANLDSSMDGAEAQSLLEVQHEASYEGDDLSTSPVVLSQPSLQIATDSSHASSTVKAITPQYEVPLLSTSNGEGQSETSDTNSLMVTCEKQSPCFEIEDPIQTMQATPAPVKDIPGAHAVSENKPTVSECSSRDDQDQVMNGLAVEDRNSDDELNSQVLSDSSLTDASAPGSHVCNQDEQMLEVCDPIDEKKQSLSPSETSGLGTTPEDADFQVKEKKSDGSDYCKFLTPEPRPQFLRLMWEQVQLLPLPPQLKQYLMHNAKPDVALESSSPTESQERKDNVVKDRLNNQELAVSEGNGEHSSDAESEQLYKKKSIASL